MEGLKVFLASCAANSPDTKITVSLTNCPVGYANSLLKINSNISIMVHECENCGAIQRNIIKHNDLRQLLEWHPVVSWIDNDAIVRGPLDAIYEGVESNTLKMWVRPKKKVEYRYQAGVYSVGSGEYTKRWVEDIIKGLNPINSDGDGYDYEHWFTPQVLIYECVNRGMDVVELPESYNDSKFKDKSTIWHCKSSHFNDPKYQKEYRRYLEQAGT